MHGERFAAVAYALLGVEDGAGTGALDDDGSEEEYGAEQHEGKKGEDDVEEPFDAVLPFLHEAGVDGDEGGVEDAVDTYHAEDDVACIGGDFDDDFATSVEHAEYLLDAGVLGVFDGDDDLFDIVLGNEAGDVGGGAEAWHYGFETAFAGRRGVVALHFDEAGEDVARIAFLVLEVEVGAVGFAVAANEEGGESELAAVDAAHGGGGLYQSAPVGEGEVDACKEEEGDVIVAACVDIVVEQQGEEEHHGADEGGDGCLLQLFEAGFAQHVLVGALERVERYPA